jgi:lysophospholipid acyltransferase (LPLAT)-like uncharacterized protein
VKIPPALICPPLNLLYKLWGVTLRDRAIGRERVDALIKQGESVLFGGWHDEIFSMLLQRDDWPVAAIVSRSRDGEYLSRLLHGLGFKTVRGSSSRGGAAALLQAAAALKKDRLSTFVALDGPRGPRHRAKDGIFLLAHHAGAKIVPVRAFNQKAWQAGSWDRFQVPKPFSRTLVAFGEPYRYEAPDLTDTCLARERTRLLERLAALENEHAAG